MFVTTWHYLDHPVIKEVEKQPVNVENNYYLQQDDNYFIMPTPPYHPVFQQPKPGKTSNESAIYFYKQVVEEVVVSRPNLLVEVFHLPPSFLNIASETFLLS